uniref:Mitochondrial ribosomal protein S21 n=1 Tax=Amphiprion ocellaris TaxID=80972 RepID=A0AAQ6A5P1_AMPOC
HVSGGDTFLLLLKKVVCTRTVSNKKKKNNNNNNKPVSIATPSPAVCFFSLQDTLHSNLNTHTTQSYAGFVERRPTGAEAQNLVLNQEGVIDDVKRKRYFEKPCRERQRKNFENCRRIYHMEMGRKIAFISRTNREDPWVGC